MSLEYLLTILKPMLEGAQTTILLFLIAIVVSIPLGFLLTLAVKSGFKPLSWLAQAYIYVMRGTPLLLQLLLIVFGLPMIPVIGEYMVLDRFVAACLGFILNYAAYFAEIFRGGLLSIDKGQYEASKVLGLNKWQTYNTCRIAANVPYCLAFGGKRINYVSEGYRTALCCCCSGIAALCPNRSQS